MATLPALVPTGDGTPGGVQLGAWTDDAGGVTNIYQRFDEGISGAVDTDYVRAIASSLTTSATGTFTLSDMPADFLDMDALSYNVRNRQAGRSDDTLDLRFMICDGSDTTNYPVLAGASAGNGNSGTLWQAARMVTLANITGTAFANTGATAFPYVNTTATKTQWDAAVVVLTPFLTVSMSSDGATIQLSAVEFTGTYTTSGPPPVALAGKASAATNAKASTVRRARRLVGTAPTASSARAVVRRARRIAGKAATATNATAAVSRARRIAGKAATATNARATLTVSRGAVVLAGKAATATSAKASTVRRARPVAGKAATATSARATSTRRNRGLAAKTATATSAKASTTVRARRLVGRSATATAARATLTVTAPTGGPVPLAGKAATATSARATVRRARRLDGRSATSTSGRASTVRRTRRLDGRAATATNAAAALTVAVPGGKPYVWTGTVWIAYPVRLWTGTAWVEEPLYVWTGTAWVAA